MPEYSYQCSCGAKKDVICSIKEHKNKIDCDCGAQMDQVVTFSGKVFGDLEPYLDEHISDKPVWVESKKHRQELMRKNGVFEAYGRGWI